MARCPFAVWRGSPNFNPVGLTAQPRGVVFHVEAGTEAGTVAVFSRADWQASSHFGVAKDGSIDQFVDTQDRAWAEGSGNTYWWAIEHEGQSGEALTPAQIEADARIIAWLRTIEPFPLQLTDDPNGTGLGWHGMGAQGWGGHTQCPGEPIKANRQDVINRINQGGDDLSAEDVSAIETHVDATVRDAEATINKAQDDHATNLLTVIKAVAADVAAIKAKTGA
jgi:hypothetical protein